MQDGAASSVFNADARGAGHCQGGLYSTQCWRAAADQLGEWYEISVGVVPRQVRAPLWAFCLSV